MNSNDNQTPAIISDLADMVGGTIHEVGLHPDGESGFATMSWPLPATHWLYERTEDGFTPDADPRMLIGADHASARFLFDHIRPAIQYALRCATRSGRDDDFDPDCVLQQARIGMFGYFTSDGTSSSMEEELEKGKEKVPAPQLLTNVLIEALQLAVNAGTVDPVAVQAAMSPWALVEAADRHTERLAKAEREHAEWCKAHGIESGGDAPVGYIAEDIGPAPDFGSDPPANTSISLDRVQNLIQEAKKDLP